MKSMSYRVVLKALPLMNMLKVYKLISCDVPTYKALSPQQTSRASACMRNSGGIFLSAFQVGREGLA